MHFFKLFAKTNDENFCKNLSKPEFSGSKPVTARKN